LRFRKQVRGWAKRILIKARSQQMAIDRNSVYIRKKSCKPLIFNLDLHISVLRDLAPAIEEADLQLISWSISGSNRFIRSLFKISDPVRVINNATWSGLNPNLIAEFNLEYCKFLSQFDGFVVTHTPAFAQIFLPYKKPILILNSTRYEAPYTSSPDLWGKLNRDLVEADKSSRILISSNNQGDNDYLNYFTGINSTITPSLCDYTNFRFSGKGSKRVIVSRSARLEEKIESLTRGEWIGIRKVLGQNFTWKDFDLICEVLYIPYNISTMSLFEYATAGIPVRVPDRDLLKQLALEFPGVLTELSYFQVKGLNTSELSTENPANYSANGFIDWWLDRADFYNSELMPGVRQIHDLGELNEDLNPLQDDLFLLRKQTELRNIRLFNGRQKLIDRFKLLL